MPSTGEKFLVGQISTTDLIKFQGIGQAAGMEDMTREELVKLKDDPEAKVEMAGRMVDAGMTLADMVDIILPSMVKEPKILPGDRPDGDVSAESLYRGELDPRDTMCLMNYAMKELKLEDMAYFR